MNSIISVVFVAIICGFWIIVFARALYKSAVGRKNTDNRHAGRIVTGRIISADVKGSGSMARTSITVEFPNFSNSDVQETFMFKDTKPHENRYEEGKTTQLVLEEDPKKGPSVRLAESKIKGSNTLSFIFFLLLAGSIYGTYALYQLVNKEIGGNWSNLDHLDVMPGLSITGAAFIFSIVLMQLVFRAVRRGIGKKSKNKDAELKLYGIKTKAKILKVEETGTKINDNPVIRFHYEYEDQFGNSYKGKDQKVVGLIQLANINEVTEKDVLYLKDTPSESRMMDSMKKTMVQGCLKLTSLFMALLFTIILMSMFVTSLLAL